MSPHQHWHTKLLIVLAASMGLLWPGGCGETTPRKAEPAPGKKTEWPKPVKPRQPAVAGMFYPADKQELAKLVEQYLAKAEPKLQAGDRVRALVCPHAGLVYSGPIAAFGYKTVAGRDIQTVVVLAPSHYARCEGAALSDYDGLETPLGVVPVSPLKEKLAESPPFVVNPPAEVRCPWAAESPLKLPAGAKPTPHTWEHSLEVQIPFIQKVLPDSAVLPVVMGDTDEAKAAEALLPLVDEHVLLVASSDLSHYEPYEKAQELDQACVKAICDLNGKAIGPGAACGRGPIRTVLHIARKFGWQARLLDLRNSGDTSGDKTRGVVGYAAIAFVDQPQAGHGGAKYIPQERAALLQLARNTLATVTCGDKAHEPDEAKLPKSFLEKRACFVTLTRDGRLRGCIGHLQAMAPLYKAVIQNATAAALEDPRFRPVKAGEVPLLDIEVSVLTDPQPLEFTSPDDLLKKLVPHRDGVILSKGGHRATYLPQVWEHFPDKEEFLGSLCEKAGLAARAWREPGVRIEIYHAEAFSEKEEGKRPR